MWGLEALSKLETHDFIKFIKYSLVPSGLLIVNIPEDISSLWYPGQVLVGLKDATGHYPDLQSTALDSVSHVKVLLLKLLERLELIGHPASSSELNEL